jgi:biotin carboxyl carrier protein
MKVQLSIDGKLRSMQLEAGERKGSYVGELDGEPVEFEAAFTMPDVVSLIVLRGEGMEGRAFRCVLDRGSAGANGKSISFGSHTYPYYVHDPRSLATRRKRAAADEGTLLLKATMAGRVVRIVAEAGSEVEAHGGVIVIEAMKMQNELRSPRAGRVVELRVVAGEMVSPGQVLAVIE